MKSNQKSVVALVFEVIFFILGYLSPVLYTVFWLSSGYANSLAIMLSEAHAENVKVQITIFLLVFLIFYVPALMALSILKFLLYSATGLRRTRLFSLRLEIAKLLLLVPGLRKIAGAIPLSEYDNGLYQQLHAWAVRNGNLAVEILVVRAKHYTSQINAFFFGLGKKPLLILVDTLFDSFTKDEIEAILAHEFGHRNDLLSSFGIDIIRLPGAALILYLGFIYTVQVQVVELTPIMLLILLAYWFFTDLLDKSASRYQELMADTYAALHISQITVFHSALEKLAALSFDTISLPKVVEILISSHPSTAHRLANLKNIEKALENK